MSTLNVVLRSRILIIAHVGFYPTAAALNIIPACEPPLRRRSLQAVARMVRAAEAARTACSGSGRIRYRAGAPVCHSAKSRNRGGYGRGNYATRQDMTW